MSALGFFLWLAGDILFRVIVVFMMAIPTGFGLAIGLHYGKTWLKLLSLRRSGKKVKKKANKLADDLVEEELAAAAIATGN